MSIQDRIANLSMLTNTFYRLGPVNVFMVLLYRFQLKLGYYLFLQPAGEVLDGRFFTHETHNFDSKSTSFIDYFSYHRIAFQDKPSWLSNPWVENSDRAFHKPRHWSEISDFAENVGDIKTVWEPSRFDWMPKMAMAWKTGKAVENLYIVESWLRDWNHANPVNQGPNWKCGQEASIRCLNVYLTCKIFGSNINTPSPTLIEFFEQHALRILPTVFYAKAQNNNHGTSEAVGLFVIGCFLKKYGSSKQKGLGEKSLRKGRRLIENRIRTIISRDGSFSQQSTNYHRFMLDTISLCELVRREFTEKQFSTVFYQRMKAATLWLRFMLDPKSGDVPNMGPNDGTYFCNVDALPYRDFRPSVNRALVLFCHERLATNSNDSLLGVFDFPFLDLPVVSAVQSKFMDKGGYARLNLSGVEGHLVFRFPMFSFRAGTGDVHHVDIWANGRNIALDSGTYSYNGKEKDKIGFHDGTRGHCTIMFDDEDQTVKLSHFLKAINMKATTIQCDVDAGEIVSAYRNYSGCWHKREICILDKKVIVKDSFGGFERKAQLIWRLPTDLVSSLDHRYQFSDFTLQITGGVSFNTEIVDGKSSLYYMDAQNSSELLIEVEKPGSLVSVFSF